MIQLSCTSTEHISHNQWVMANWIPGRSLKDLSWLFGNYDPELAITNLIKYQTDLQAASW